MGRAHLLRGRSRALGAFLCRDPALLARLSRRFALARLLRHPAEDLGPGRAGERLRDPGAAPPRRPRPRAPFRHRVARPHGEPGAREARSFRTELTFPERRNAMQRMIVAALAAGAFASGAAHAQKWDMPTPYSDGEFHTRNVVMFADEVKKATGGKLDIVVHSNGSLIKHPDILRAVSSGQVPVAEFLLGQFGNEDPVFAADNVPFVAPGYDNAWKFYQAQKPVLEKKLQGRGMKLLYAVAWPG